MAQGSTFGLHRSWDFVGFSVGCVGSSGGEGRENHKKHTLN